MDIQDEIERDLQRDRVEELIDGVKYHKDNLSPEDWRDWALHNLDITIEDLEDYEWM